LQAEQDDRDVLVYQDEQQLELKRFIEEFNKNISETGAILRITHFDDT
jgi:hypothetical protein